jgi:hypothetical protein
MSIKFNADLSSVAALIGAVDGAEEATDNDRYISDLIRFAHAEAVDEFNMEAIAFGQAGQIKHMFEWGTQGINQGRTTRRMNPMNKDARLWRNTIDGVGKSQVLDFEYKHSQVPIPNPTTTKTKISQRYLTKLSRGKTFFWNKAFVMESGTPVHIKPKNGGRLFIPLMGNPSEKADKASIKRGFIMTPHEVEARPGANSAGTFTAFWTRFWEGRGQDIIQTSMETGFKKDVETAVAKADETRGAMKPVQSNDFEAQVQTSKARTKASIKAAAAARNRRVVE